MNNRYREEEKLENMQDAHEKAVNALINIAAQSRLLILLDNVDDERLFSGGQIRSMFCGFPMSDDILRNIHIVATTRIDMHFGEREAFRPFPLNRKAQHFHIKFLCLFVFFRCSRISLAMHFF